MHSDDSDSSRSPHAQAIAWFSRMTSGEVTAEDTRAFEVWRNAHPEHDRHYRNLAFFWDASAQLPAQQLRTLLPKPAPARFFTTRRAVAFGSAFAALSVMTVTSWHWSDGTPEHTQDVLTQRGQRQQITLPDNSILDINAGTQATVAFYADRRIITLAAGEIFFSVAHNKARPFIVETDLGTITVTGTQFNVRHDGKQVLVSVESGSVNVATGPWWQRQTQQLSAGLGTVIAAQGTLDSVRMTNVANNTAWRHGKIVFENMPLAQAVSEMNRYLAQPATLLATNLGGYRIAGVFSIDDPNAMIDALSAIAPVKVYRLEDGQVRIVAR